jgi:uncharacterized membrane protein
MHKITRNFTPGIIVLFFGIIYCLISLANHYLFRTSALDLGMFNQAVYHISHFQKNIFTLDIKENEANYFASHFSPIIYLYSPLYFIFGSYTLLIIQVVAVLAGGIAVFKFASERSEEPLIPILIMIHFYGVWGIYSALAFDFHDNVVAAMLVPWFIFFYLKNNRKLTVLFFVLILISKENMALWMIFILFGLILWMWRQGWDKVRKNFLFNIILILSALIYFLLVIEIIMPAFSGNWDLTQMTRYSSYGGSTLEIALYLITHPREIILLLFQSPLEGDIFRGIKMETHLMVLLSGGIAFLFFPEFLVMLIPVYLQKFLSDDYALWGINGHYSIEFVPVLSFAIIALISGIRNKSLKISSLGIIIILTFTATITTFDKRKSLWYNPVNTRFYSKIHYQSGLNHISIYKEIKKIPADAVISASTFLTPHLAARKKIFMFPVVKDAEYILLLTKNRIPYPLNAEQFNEELIKYRESERFEIIYEKDELVVFRRRKQD